MKRNIFFILVLLYSLSGYTQISVDRDSLVIDLSKDKFVEEADADGLYQVVTEVNELSSEDSDVRSKVYLSGKKRCSIFLYSRAADEG